MIESIVRAALRFKALLAALAVALLVVGTLSLRQMPADATPELAQAPVLEVQTEALGLSAPEVEQYVTDALENNLLGGIMGVWDIRSQSVAGLSDINLYFEPGTDLYNDRLLVEERLTNAFSLPNISTPPVLIQPTSTNSRVLMIGLSSSSQSPLGLSYLARWIVKPKLSGVPGVSDVAIFGERDRQIQVQVDPARLAANHVTLSEVISKAGNAQLVSPLTFLQGSTPGTGGFLDGPNQRLEIRPVLPLGNPKNVGAIPIGGKHLGQVANVVLGHQPLIGDAVVTNQRGQAVSNGHAVVLEVEMLPGASTLGVTKGLERALGQLRLAAQRVTVDTSFFRRASYVQTGIDNLTLGLLIAAALGLLALGAVLLALRAVVVAAISVAVSMMAGLVLLQLFGYTFNELVLLGLMVASAIVVDDAVVATHEVTKLAREHPPNEPFHPLVAELYGRLRATLGYAGLTVLLCLAPLFVSKGLAATFVHPMVLSVGLIVIASMLVSLTVAPALSLLLLSRGIARRASPLALRRVRGGYERVVHAALQIPRGALLAACLVGLGAVIVFPFLHEPAAPTFKDRNLIVAWQGPSGASLTKMDRVTSRVLTELRSLPAVDDAAAILGRAVSGDRIVDPSSGQIFVSLKSGVDYNSGVSAVRSIVQRTPGMQASVQTFEGLTDAGVFTPPRHEVTVRVYGAELPTLARLARGIKLVMSHTAGLAAPRVELPAQQPDIEVAVNNAKAAQHGVLPGDARRAASTLVEGLVVGNFFQSNAVFDVTVMGVPRIRQSIQDVRNLLIDTSNGGHVRLGQIAQITLSHEPTDIRHQAYSPYVDVVASVRSGQEAAVQAQIARKIQSLRYPLAYHAEVLGGTPVDATSGTTFIFYVLAAALGIVLLLQAALSSWRLAALVFVTAPLALAGGLLVGVATGSAESLGADAGLLAIYLFTLRQAIAQVVHIRRFQALDGGPLTPGTVVRALASRLAPQLGAVIVIAVMLIPFVAIGDVAGNEITHTAAAVMLGGLLTSTLLVAFLLPAICLRLGPTEPFVLFDPLEGIDHRVPDTADLTPVSGSE